MRNSNPERLRHLSKATQLVRRATGIQLQLANELQLGMGLGAFIQSPSFIPHPALWGMGCCTHFADEETEALRRWVGKWQSRLWNSASDSVLFQCLALSLWNGHRWLAWGESRYDLGVFSIVTSTAPPQNDGWADSYPWFPRRQAGPHEGTQASTPCVRAPLNFLLLRPTLVTFLLLQYYHKHWPGWNFLWSLCLLYLGLMR